MCGPHVSHPLLSSLYFPSLMGRGRRLAEEGGVGGRNGDWRATSLGGVRLERGRGNGVLGGGVDDERDC